MRLTSLLVALTVTGLMTAAVHADYTLEALVGGSNEVDVAQGTDVTIDLVLTSDSGDQLESALFYTEFSAAGLVYNSYLWGDPFPTGPSGDGADAASPNIGDLPQVIGVDTFDDPLAPGVVDVAHDGLTPDGQFFGEGTIVSMNVGIPEDYPLGPVDVFTVPDLFVVGLLSQFTEIATFPGAPLTLNVVVPEPASIALLGLGSLAMLRRRRLAAG